MYMHITKAGKNITAVKVKSRVGGKIGNGNRSGNITYDAAGNANVCFFEEAIGIYIGVFQ